MRVLSEVECSAQMCRHGGYAITQLDSYLLLGGGRCVGQLQLWGLETGGNLRGVVGGGLVGECGGVEGLGGGEGEVSCGPFISLSLSPPLFLSSSRCLSFPLCLPPCVMSPERRTQQAEMSLTFRRHLGSVRLQGLFKVEGLFKKSVCNGTVDTFPSVTF